MINIKLVEILKATNVLIPIVMFSQLFTTTQILADIALKNIDEKKNSKKK